ncbi:conserved domain protein [Ruminococcus albus 8]|uniref:Conserved domain protein n=1 Tax=Ruminococcus albus 8 TaxID=246199 RepID=E9SI08_RUMAL|nr:conserved domain protein [Ruminococcus albus 8]
MSEQGSRKPVLRENRHTTILTIIYQTKKQEQNYYRTVTNNYDKHINLS